MHVLARGARDRMVRPQRGQHPADADTVEQRQRAAGVVGIAVADDHAVQRPDAARLQVRQDARGCRRWSRAHRPDRCRTAAGDAAVSISSAMPCPTSNAVTVIRPGGGWDGCAASSGSHVAGASQRTGQPRGASIQMVPNMAQQKSQNGGVGALQTAWRKPLNHCSTPPAARPASAQAPAPARPAARAACCPTKASGVTTRLTRESPRRSPGD
jgi:hypothetical protein